MKLAIACVLYVVACFGLFPQPASAALTNKLLDDSVNTCYGS